MKGPVKMKTDDTDLAVPVTERLTVLEQLSRNHAPECVR